MIQFTCLVPVFNSSSTILSTVESLLNQTVKDLRVVVLNNGSTDNVIDILGGVSDDRLKVISYEHVDSLGESLNRCFNKSLIFSKYFSICHADDIYDPDYVATAIKEMALVNFPTILFCLARHIDQHGNPIKDSYVSYKNLSNILLPKYSGALGAARILTWNTLFAPSAIYRLVDIDRFNKFSNSLTLYTDAFFWCKWLLSGYDIRVIKCILLNYRIHTKQQSSWARLRDNQSSEITKLKSMIKDENRIHDNVFLTMCLCAHKFLRIFAKIFRLRI